MWFQSTPLREGRLYSTSWITSCLSFNPRPCARGDSIGYLREHSESVSIHAPARGATEYMPDIVCKYLVSIHAPARGATKMNVECLTEVLFQSTPLREGRLISETLLVRIILFQSTPLREGRHEAVSACTRPPCFNPRPCARGDGHRFRYPRGIFSFNPRPCARGDFFLLLFELVFDVSIHAPARGATDCAGAITPRNRFQSTPLREGRPTQALRKINQKSFNPRPCARGDFPL